MIHRIFPLTGSMFFCLLLSACQTCGPFLTEWYLIKRPDGSPSMYLELLNKGYATRVHSVVINPVSKDLESGYRRRGLDKTMGTGEFFVFDVSFFTDSQGKKFEGCRVPVLVTVQCTREGQGGEYASSQLEGVEARVSSSMPNYLPQTWIDGCSNDPKN